MNTYIFAETEAPATQTLILHSGQSYEGQVQGVRDDHLIFIRPSAGGQAEYTFTPDEVERIDFRNAAEKTDAAKLLAAGRAGEALPLLQAIYEQQAPYLAFIPEPDRAYFLKLVVAAREAEEPYLSVGVAKTLLPYIQDETVRDQLESLILLGYYQLPLRDDTRQLALEWIMNHPRYGTSALGSYVLARLELDDGQHEAALLTALEPITFSSQYPMSYLPHCYAVAILAADALDDETEARALAVEMAARHLPWPTDDGLDNHKPLYKKLLRPPPPPDKTGLTSEAK
ncbi:MAG: hypothetical protein ACQKBW_03990 [Puniceicoccales bacterium]